MHQECVQLGAIIKKRREEKKITLKEVENATSIRFSCLQAIEEGHLGKLISPIYAHGFIVKYATFLELDADKLLDDHPYVMRILTERVPDAQELTLGIGTLEVRGTPGGEVKWLPNVMWVALSVGVILLGWFIARYFGLF